MPPIFPHSPVNEDGAGVDLCGVMIPKPLPDSIQVDGFAVKESLNLAVSTAIFESASASQMIDCVRGVEAFILREGRDEGCKQVWPPMPQSVVIRRVRKYKSNQEIVDVDLRD